MTHTAQTLAARKRRNHSEHVLPSAVRLHTAALTGGRLLMRRRNTAKLTLA